MQYKEYQPSALLSQHIECYWEMQLLPGELDSPFELLSPDCTFDILFTKQTLFVRSITANTLRTIDPGVVFIGQKTQSINFSVSEPSHLFGIRFKPFAFANLITTPLYQLNDQILGLHQLFSLRSIEKAYIQDILNTENIIDCLELSELLVINLLEHAFHIDQTFRAQLNYILDRKGLIKVSNLFTEFGISKVTLRNHFLSKMGLSPKKVSRIWRINYFLQLQQSNPDIKLTELCLEAGFYDQAHFIKEFKFFFGAAPRDFFQRESKLLKISQAIISKRFSNHYDPVPVA